jgi:RNA polymerase sigma-70 factor (ECF subfamily)
VRQLAHRAREHVQSRRRRFDPVDPQQSVQLTTQFLTAAATGDVEGLMAMLAADVVWTADSDGKVSAARRPVVGAGKVAKLLMGLMRAAGSQGRAEAAIYNSAPALILYLGDKLEGVVTVEVIDGKITNFYAMRNPEKLASVQVRREISR